MWWSWGSARVSCAFLARPRSAQVTPLVLRSARDGRWRVQQGVAADCPAAPTGDWVGVQLDKPSGTHDGGAHGQRYFTCAFSRPSSACVAARNHPLRDRRILVERNTECVRATVLWIVCCARLRAQARPTADCMCRGKGCSPCILGAQQRARSRACCAGGESGRRPTTSVPFTPGIKWRCKTKATI